MFSARAEGRLLFKSGHCLRAAFVNVSMRMSASHANSMIKLITSAIGFGKQRTFVIETVTVHNLAVFNDNLIAGKLVFIL